MDPCPFVRLTVGNLVLHIPTASRPARTAVHPAASPCFCKIKLSGFPPQFAMVPCISPENFSSDGSVALTLHAQGFTPLAATFHLNKADLMKLAEKSFFRSKELSVTISIYTGRGGTSCWMKSGRLLGKVTVPLNLAGAETKPVVFHNEWINVGKTRFHLDVRSEPDPRFVFQFDGEPQCSPQVFLIQGSIQQPVFTCKFSFRPKPERNQPARLEHSFSRVWMSSFGSDRERPGKERKGWSVTVHDLSGSPVAAASMVTPFVASPGSDRVSRSNPGAWLILRPGDNTWKPWGRLEAWRERGGADGLGYRFELIPEYGAANGVVVAESTISIGKGGKFVIDLGANGKSTAGSAASTPAVSPRGSGDFGYGLWPYCVSRGFVMSATVAGNVNCNRNGDGKGAKPRVEISVPHVNCTEDAAAFVALSAAIHLSMEACRLFTQKLPKELCPPPDLLF